MDGEGCSNVPRCKLSLEGLMNMTPVFQGRDVVGLTARQLLLSHVRSQSNVREIFFPNHRQEKFEEDIDKSWFDFDTFALLFVCQAICELKDEFQIYSLLETERIYQSLEGVYRSPDWKKIGFALYTLLFADLVKDNETHVPFRAYLDSDRRQWASRLSAMVRDSKWLYQMVNPIVQGHLTEPEYNRELNILFIKLHLLDPTTVMPTYDHLRKALPNLNLEIVTTNYLGDPLDWRLIKDEVQLAVHKATYPTNASRLSLDEIELYFGVPVIEFIMQDVNELGLWTGKYPDNKRISSFRDRCSLMKYCTIL